MTIEDFVLSLVTYIHHKLTENIYAMVMRDTKKRKQRIVDDAFFTFTQKNICVTLTSESVTLIFYCMNMNNKHQCFCVPGFSR